MKQFVGLGTLLTWLALPWLFWQTQQLRPREIMATDLCFEGSYLGFSEDGMILACTAYAWSPTKVDESYVTALWSMTTGKKMAELPGRCRAVAIAPDGQTVASENEDGSLTLLDTAHYQKQSELAGHDQSVESLAFSLDGTKLASGTCYESKLWDLSSGKELARFRLPEHARQSRVQFSPDGHALVLGIGAGTVTVSDLASGRQLGTFCCGVEGHFTPLALSSDCRTLATENGGGTVQLWEVRTGLMKASWSLNGDVSNMRFSADGNTLVVCYVHTVPGPTQLARSITLSMRSLLGSGSRHLFADDDWVTVVIDVNSGQELARLPACEIAAFLPDGKTLATYGQDDSSIKLWDLPPRRPVHPLLAWAVTGVAVILTASWWRLRRKARAGTAS